MRKAVQPIGLCKGAKQVHQPGSVILHTASAAHEDQARPSGSLKCAHVEAGGGERWAARCLLRRSRRLSWGQPATAQNALRAASTCRTTCSCSSARHPPSRQAAVLRPWLWSAPRPTCGPCGHGGRLGGAGRVQGGGRQRRRRPGRGAAQPRTPVATGGGSSPPPSCSNVPGGARHGGRLRSVLSCSTPSCCCRADPEKPRTQLARMHAAASRRRAAQPTANRPLRRPLPCSLARPSWHG